MKVENQEKNQYQSKVMNDLKISYMIGNISSLKTLLSSVASVLE